MANIGGPRTPAQYFLDRMLQDELPTCFRYAGTMIGDAAPAASELFLNGELDSRIYLPEDSYIFGQFIGSAWNTTTNDAPGGCRIEFGIENVAGTVAFAPANLAGAGGNPVSAGLGEAGTWAVVADDTNKALRVNFTPTANHTYKVAGVLYFAFAAAQTRFPNDIRQIN